MHLLKEMGLYFSLFLVIESLCYCSFFNCVSALASNVHQIFSKKKIYIYIHMSSLLLLPKPNEVEISASLKVEKQK